MSWLGISFVRYGVDSRLVVENLQTADLHSSIFFTSDGGELADFETAHWNYLAFESKSMPRSVTKTSNITCVQSTLKLVTLVVRFTLREKMRRRI